MGSLTQKHVITSKNKLKYHVPTSITDTRSYNSHPSGVGTPLLWLDANNGITASGTEAVSQWVDRQGNFTFVQATGANQPVRVYNQQNGQTCVRFSGSPKIMVSNENSTWGVGSYSAYLVAKRTDTSGTPFCVTAYNIMSIDYAGTSGFNNTTTSGTGTYASVVDSVQLKNTIKTTGVNFVSYQNGVLKQTSTTAGMLVDFANGVVNLGFAFVYCPCDIYEILVFGTAHTDAERIQIENYIKRRYAIPNI